jgi:hypothetical protein
MKLFLMIFGLLVAGACVMWGISIHQGRIRQQAALDFIESAIVMQKWTNEIIAHPAEVRVLDLTMALKRVPIVAAFLQYALPAKANAQALIREYTSVCRDGIVQFRSGPVPDGYKNWADDMEKALLEYFPEERESRRLGASNAHQMDPAK